MAVGALYRSILSVDYEFGFFLAAQITTPIFRFLFGVEMLGGAASTTLFYIPTASVFVADNMCSLSCHDYFSNMSDQNISHLSHHTRDGSRWTVEQMLADALSDVREHRRTPTKAIVLFLDDSESKYDIGFNQSGLSMSQALALIEVAKSQFLREMGY